MDSLGLARLATRMKEPGDGRLSRRDLWEPGVRFPRATRPSEYGWRRGVEMRKVPSELG